MIKLLISAILLVALLVTYFVIDKTVISKEDPPETTIPIETTDGEVIGAADRILMFEQVRRVDIQSIDVHNEYGEFTIYKDQGEFFIKDHKNVILEKELFASFITSCGYTLSLSRIDEHLGFSEYGLDDAKTWYTLTTRTGEKHTVYIGDKTLTGDGYYARYEGRDSVYVLDNSIADTLLMPVETMVTPLLCYYEYSLEKRLEFFKFFKGEDELYFSLEPLKAEEEVDIEAMATYKMTFPTSYVPNETCDTTFQKLASFLGTKTVALGPTEEDFAKYGIDEPKYSMHFKADGVEHMLLVSERQPNGNYYVGSGLLDIIAEVDAATISFIEHDLIKWVSPYIFRMSIASVDTLEIKTDDFSETFRLTGTGETLRVQTLSNQKYVDVNNFKSLYRTLLTVCIEGDPEFSEEDKESRSTDENLYMTMKVKTRSGLERTYKFYRYSERRSLLEINGRSDFYVLHNIVEKIRNDSEKVVNGITVDHTQKYN